MADENTVSLSVEQQQDAKTRQYVYRLIDAGATGLADILIAEAEILGASKGSILYPQLYSSGNNKNPPPPAPPLQTSSNRRMELVKKELIPISWTMWIVNIISLSFYINESGKTFFAGFDLVKLFQTFVLCSTRKSTNTRLWCGCRRSTLPLFYRIHNSYITWNPDKKVLVGTPPSSDEFYFLKKTIFQQFFFCILPSLTMYICALVFPDIYEFSPTPISYPTRFDVMLLAKIVFPALGIVIPVIMIPLTILLVLGPSLVGSREGSLPTFMPHLLKASAPEYMISYSWKGGKSQFARGLAEVLPNAWIDVRSLVGGQLVSHETRSGSANARVTIVILDPEYLGSRNCASEFLSVVTKRKHKGTSGCHQTVVLIDDSFLQSPTGNNGADQKIQASRQLLEASGFVVTPSNPAINWRDITTILTEVGCKVFHTPDALLEHLENRACRAPEHKDVSLCIHWWMKYGSSSFGGSSAHVSDYRVPWNIVGNKSINSKRKLHVKSWCERANRVCCRSRPYTRTSPFSWEENSVTTGAGGAWISYDASTPPQPHVDITPQFVLGWVLFVAVLVIGSIVIIACVWTIDTNAEALVQAKQCVEFFPALGGGFVSAIVLAGGAYIGFFFYSTDIFTPASILHSSVLFPLFAFSEIQDVTESNDDDDDDDNKENKGTGASNVTEQRGYSATCTVRIVGRGKSNEGGDIELMNTPGLTSVLVENPIMRRPDNHQDENQRRDVVPVMTSTANSLLLSTMPTSSASSSFITNPLRIINPTSTGAVVAVSPSLPNHHPCTQQKPITGHRRKFSIQFAHDESPIKFSIQHFNKFLAENVFGFDLVTDKEKGYPEVHSAKSILDNPDHPLPLTVYVFFLDSPISQQAWSTAMQRKYNRWQPEHVVLVTTFATINTGGSDSASAAGILKKLLTLKDEKTNREGDKEVVREILHAFEALDRGDVFPVDAVTMPSSQAAREALHEILPQLGFVLVPCMSASGGVGYASPRFGRGGGNGSGMTKRNVPLLVPTLGPLLTFGPTSTLMKGKTLKALQESANVSGSEKKINVRTSGVTVASPSNATHSGKQERDVPTSNVVPSSSSSSSSSAREIDNAAFPSVSRSSSSATGGYGPSIRRTTSVSSPTSPRSSSSRRSPSPTNEYMSKAFAAAARASPRMQEHMLIVYNLNPGSDIPVMPDGSPYRGLVPAVLEAVASKLGHILKLNGKDFMEEMIMREEEEEEEDDEGEG